MQPGFCWRSRGGSAGRAPARLRDETHNLESTLGPEAAGSNPVPGTKCCSPSIMIEASCCLRDDLPSSRLGVVSTREGQLDLRYLFARWAMDRTDDRSSGSCGIPAGSGTGHRSNGRMELRPSLVCPNLRERRTASISADPINQWLCSSRASRFHRSHHDKRSQTHQIWNALHKCNHVLTNVISRVPCETGLV